MTWVPYRATYQPNYPHGTRVVSLGAAEAETAAIPMPVPASIDWSWPKIVATGVVTGIVTQLILAWIWRRRP